MSKYDEVYFMGDNQAISRVPVDSSKTMNRGAFSGSLAALQKTIFIEHTLKMGPFGLPRIGFFLNLEYDPANFFGQATHINISERSVH